MNQPGSQDTPKLRKWISWKQVIRVLVLVIVLVVIASIFVSRYEPDPQDTVLMGQSVLYSGSSISPRILVRNYVNQKPIEGASVSIKLTGTDISKNLGQFTTNLQGNISGPIEIPDLPDGNYTLTVDTQSSIGKDHIAYPVQIKKPYKIYVTTDKPIYQPGQTFHLRAMVLNRTSLKPFSGQTIIFEVEDPKGNKIFKEEKKSSEFGIAGADLDIAREVNLGRYRVRVVVGNEESERIVTVEKYVLPKFKIQIHTSRPFYLPADELSGTLSAQYFFGKPVEKASVEITGKTIVEKETEIFRITGTTNSEGIFSFQTKLSDYFTGIPLAGGNALVELEAVVKDTAGHKESGTSELIIAQEPIQIGILPECGRIVPNVENILYIMTTYPHGEPAICTGDINGQPFATDELGIAVYKIIPKEEHCKIQISVQDKQGNLGQIIEDIKLLQHSENFLLRTDKAIYHAGETLKTTLLSSEATATFFIDILKDRQTMLTRTVDVEKGIGQLDIDLPASLFGTLKLNAYFITEKGESRRSSRIVHICRPQQLGITASLDQKTYQPGQLAKISFLVSDLQGKPVGAALSLSAVDEAVFYVGENHPGLLKQFFEADEELMKPAYQTKFMISPEKLLSADNPEQNLAKALFANIMSDPWKNLDKLRGKMEPEEIERYRANIENGQYDALLDEPQYKELLEYLGAGGDDYTLKSATFSQKKADSELFREQYFSTLTAAVIIIIVVSFFVLVIIAAVYSSIQMLRMPKELNETEGLIYKELNRITFASTLYILVPVILYPLFGIIGSLMWEFFDWDEEYFMYLAILVSFVIDVYLACSQIKACIILTARPETSSYAPRLFWIPILFIIQYTATRLIIILGAADYSFEDYGVAAFFITLAATLFILILSIVLTRKIADRLQLDLSQKKGLTLIQILVFIGVMVFLFAISMPALCSVKSLSKSATLSSDLNMLAGAAFNESGADGSVLFSTVRADTTAIPEEKEKPLMEPSRIRRYFPETLYWQPELITDENGRATLTLPLADSITTWKMNADAVSAEGQLGSDEKDITVFQDFFVDLDLPVCLTQHDEISIPILCYNYLAVPQQVQLNLEPQNWYSLSGVDTVTVNLGPNEVKSVSFAIRAEKVGSHPLTVFARGQSMSDAIGKTVEVKPDGTEITDIQEGTLITAAEHNFVVPEEAIADSQSLILKIYPTAFNVLLEGMDSIFQKPYGCFEQTSSTTYPNVMALQYMKDTGQITPEVEVKARKYINEGYQRLLTFEVAGGGFDWFGKAPANELLTAYGLMEFTDMAKVYNVDPALIQRTARWLLSKQRPDGAWGAGQLHGTLNAVQGEVMTTAYITWSLVQSGQNGQEIQEAFNYLRSHRSEMQDPYIIAVCANAFLNSNPQDGFGRDLVAVLASKFKDDAKSAYLTSQVTGAMYSVGECLDIETTALGTLSLLKCNRYPELVKKSLIWLSGRKDQYGTWYSTHATILALKAMIAGTGTPLGGEKPYEVSVSVNDNLVSTIRIEPRKSDVMNFISLTDAISAGSNVIRIKGDGNSELPYQLVGSYWIAGKTEPAETVGELTIDVSYDKQELKIDDTLISRVKVVNNKLVAVNMAIVDLGIPPGFDVDTTAFQRLVEKNVLAKYETTGNQCILYIRDIAPKSTLEFEYSLKAKCPIRARIPRSEVYEYYNPQNRNTSSAYDVHVSN